MPLLLLYIGRFGPLGSHLDHNGAMVTRNAVSLVKTEVIYALCLVFVDCDPTLPAPLFISGHVAEYPNPDSLLRRVITMHEIGWRNKAYTGLVEKARRIADQKAHLKLYRQADRILVEQAPIIPLTYGRGHLLVKPWGRRYPVSPTTRWFWKDVIIEPH